MSSELGRYSTSTKLDLCRVCWIGAISAELVAGVEEGNSGALNGDCVPIMKHLILNLQHECYYLCPLVPLQLPIPGGSWCCSPAAIPHSRCQNTTPLREVKEDVTSVQRRQVSDSDADIQQRDFVRRHLMTLLRGEERLEEAFLAEY